METDLRFHPLNKTLAELFDAMTKKTKSGCHEWSGLLVKNKGYGSVHIVLPMLGRMHTATHRLSFRVFQGPIPDRMSVCHKCDNPPCVNPAHLFLGTTLDNSADMVLKRRSAAGERNHQSKLTEEQVIQIRAMLAKGRKQTDVAKKFGISQALVSRVHLRQGWRHI